MSHTLGFRLDDTYTDTVLTGLNDVYRLLDRASLEFWRQLAATGTQMRADQQPAGDLNHCVQIAAAHNRAALLGYALEQLDRTITRATARLTLGHQRRLEPARLPLAAAITAMILVDRLDPTTHSRMIAPLAKQATGQ